MTLSIIVAVAKNWAIGKNNRLLCHLSEDLKHFKKITMGHTIIMGQNTFESIGKPLPGRENIIISLDPHYKAEGATVFHSLDEMRHKIDKEKENFIIGGAMLYKTTLPLADKLYLTQINKEFEGDTFFPKIEFGKEFEVVEQSEWYHSEKENLPYRFVILKRKCWDWRKKDDT